MKKFQNLFILTKSVKNTANFVN